MRGAIVGIMATVSPSTSHNRIVRLKFVADSEPQFEPEWLRVNATARAFGLSRPALFKLIALEKVRSVHIKQPGATKGIRLISAASIRAYIGSFEEAITK